MNKAKNAIEPEDDEEDWQFWQGIVIEGWKPKADWGLTDFLWKFM